MSDRDFILEIDISAGYDKIKHEISSFPVIVEVIKDENGNEVIHQSKVSTVAGFALDESAGKIQSYGIGSLLSEKETDELLEKFSNFFKLANIPHRIIEIWHEVDWDKELINFKW